MKTPELLDCTLRDGGYINKWAFTERFADALYRSVSDSGCRFIEIGFFEPESRSAYPWTHLTAEDIARLREVAPQGAKIAVMINYPAVDLAEIPERSAYGADMIRVATPFGQRKEATKFAAALRDKGYLTTVNYMAISNYKNADIIELVKLIEEYSEAVDYFYVADSFGSLLPRRTHEIFTMLRFGTSAHLGFHPHNNLQLAFANCLEAMRVGVDIIDGSILGMGRVAGNLFLEAMLAYLERSFPSQFRLLPVLEFADIFMQPLKKNFSWGYSLPQLLSGIESCHPNYPTNLLAEKTHSAEEIYTMLSGLEQENKSRFSKERMIHLRSEHYRRRYADAKDLNRSELEAQVGAHHGLAVLVAGGQSILQHKDEIERFIKEKSPLVCGINRPAELFEEDVLFVGNPRRMYQYLTDEQIECPIIIGNAISEGARAHVRGPKSISVHIDHLLVDFDISSELLPLNSTVEAALVLLECGVRQLYICGLDGFKSGEGDYFYPESDAVVSDAAIHQQNQDLTLELQIAVRAFAAKGAEIGIITPTMFGDYYRSVL